MGPTTTSLLPPQLWEPAYDTQRVINSVVYGALYYVGMDVTSLSSLAGGDFTHLLVYFCALSLLLAASWLALHRIFLVVWPAYSRIQPPHKRMYVVANLSKSFILALQASSVTWWFYSFCHYRCTPDPILRVMGGSQDFVQQYSLGACNFSSTAEASGPRSQEFWTKVVTATYVSTDFVALLVVPALPLTTKIHHWAAVAFMLAVWQVQLSEYEVGQKLMMYGFWSTLAWPVNTFLALRVPYRNATGKHGPALAMLAIFSLVVYVIVCAFNWGLHLVWLLDYLINRASVLGAASALVYVSSLSLFVTDDLKLMKWLYAYARSGNVPVVATAGQQQQRKKRK
eukprot:UC1_evm3s740